eukprot:GEMP01074089.1.p1 GENE.GEMP01074089.1~~GEMP01074089.1.p1  ORF type:complete len:225 (+),score=53.42 GEMP01074089.1:403-1077(+)
MVNDTALDCVRTAADRGTPFAHDVANAWKDTREERPAFDLRQQLNERAPQQNAELASLEDIQRYCALISDAENSDRCGEDKMNAKLAGKARIHLIDYLEYHASASLGYPTLGVEVRTQRKASRLVQLLDLYDTVQQIVQVDLTVVGSRKQVLYELEKMLDNGELSEAQARRVGAASASSRDTGASGSKCGFLLDCAIREELYFHWSAKLVRAMEQILIWWHFVS